MNRDGHLQTAETVSSGSVPAVPETARHRVLLVEDHAALAEATAEFMGLHGLEVRVASCGRDALKIAEEFNPVLVLCDLSLPDMAGLDVALALRAKRRENDVLIVMLTAMGADELRGLELLPNTSGVNLFLSKPLTNESLIDLLSRLDVLLRSARPAVCWS